MFAPPLREAPDARCVLCARAKSQVHFLVKGVVGSVCSDCVQSCVTTLGDKIGKWPSSSILRATKKLEVLKGNGTEERMVDIKLRPDIAKVFPDSDAVNAVLHPLAVLITVEAGRLKESEDTLE